MSQPWLFIGRLIAFWLLFFAFFRLWFMLWLHADWGAEKPWAALIQALPLDLSMTGYLIAIPIGLYFVSILVKTPIRNLFHKIIFGYTIGLLAILVFVFGANIFIYEEWHTPLNNRALEYFKTPAVMLDSMSFSFKIGAATAYAGLVWLWIWVYSRLASRQLFTQPQTAWSLTWTPVFICLLFVTIRGGVGKVPINESAVYYSAHSFNNHAATNTAWHLVHSLLEIRSAKNNYRYFPDSTARQIVDSLYQHKNSWKPDTPWLQTGSDSLPNVIFILMESMTAQVVAELGGEPGICPNMSRLASTGILFENIYSSGYRTDQGLVAVLGGFPAQPDQSVVLLQDKAARLPSVPRELRGKGYSTAFLYGGQLTFANIGVWLRNQQFETIISGRDFSRKQLTQRWGADDMQVFQKTLQTASNLQQPFFTTILTLSLHTPYDVPVEYRPDGKPEREKFLTSARYADWAIGQFFEQAAREPWFSNTLFVLVADHGHPQPGGIWMDNPRARQVPLIFAGPLIRPEWRGRRVQKLGNHHDIPATVLNGLGRSIEKFSWSKDLFSSEAPEFAYYANENGLGWLSPGRAGFYLFSGRQWQQYWDKGLPLDEQDLAKAYLQTLYNDFLGL